MKLIDGDKLKEMLHTAAIPMTEYGRGVQTGYQYARAFIDNMPAIETETVRHGRWLNMERGTPLTGKQLASYSFSGCCSICRKQSGTQYAKRKFAFCPFCGARMDGGDEDAAD